MLRSTSIATLLQPPRITAIGSPWCSYGSVAAVSIHVGASSIPQTPVPGSNCLVSGKAGNSASATTNFRLFSSHVGALTSSKGTLYNYTASRLHKQMPRWQSSSAQTPSSPQDQDDAEKPNPSPHFKTRKNLETKKDQPEVPVVENIQAAVDERPGGHQYLLPHPIWSEKELDAVHVTHKPPADRVDKAAYYACKALRTNFDLFSGFNWGKRTESKWIYRIIFLETVAGVPGMVAAMTRHLRSLRRMQRDYGWIHTLLEEAENERMHLMTALEIKQPSLFFRLMVLGAQGIFVNIFFVSYMISPRFCHRFVGYLEEEAVITYTKLLKDLADDALPKWKDRRAPEISINYWKLRPDADFVDLFRAIRADEAHHREVNHTLSDIKPDDPNPYGPGQ